MSRSLLLLVLTTMCLPQLSAAADSGIPNADIILKNFHPKTPMNPHNTDPAILTSLLAPPSSDVLPGKLNFLNFSRPEGQRFLYLYVPTNYTASVSWPLAFFFHVSSTNSCNRSHRL